MKRIVLASANPDKLAELRTLFVGTNLEVVSVTELVSGWDVEETGITLEENAILKASSATQATGLPAVADDTGLFVKSLGGAPGIYTARFAGSDCSYSDNMDKLLRDMLGETDRRAVFRTAAAFSRPNEPDICVTGEVSGTILHQPAGDAGFGYDPVFRSDELGSSFAECTPEEKHLVSHRARAIKLLRKAVLDRIF